jgi:hypothetical protein
MKSLLGKLGVILIVPLILSVLSSCTGSHVKYIQENPNFLKPGLYAKAFSEAWGPPDEVLAYQDYRDKQFSYSAVISDSGRSVWGYGSAQSYTPTTVVWIYRNQKKALFFQQVPLLNERRNPLSTMVWKLVGWENLKLEKTGLDDDKIKAQMKYTERKINEAGIISDPDIKVFWALIEKAPKDMAFEEQVEWAIKRTKEIMSNSEKK